MPPADSLNFHHVHHLMWACYSLMVPISDDVYAGAELTLPLSGALDMIGTWPGATVTELSRKSPKTQQALSQLVARLEKLGYVERRVGSGRGVGLYLSPAGEAARIEGNRLEEELGNRMKELLGEETYERLSELLELASANLMSRKDS